VVPQGIARLDRLAWWLDDCIRLPGTRVRVGVDPLLGLIPGVGDTVAALMSLIILGHAVHYRLPGVVIARMGLNVAFDYAISVIPIVGDAADFFIKSNRWNLDLLRAYAGTEQRPSWRDYAFVFGIITGVIVMIAGGIAVVAFLVHAAFTALARRTW